jgi:CheY-like chemotaxis protein
MGGQMSVSSVLGQGSRFYFTIRLRSLERNNASSHKQFETYKDKSILLLLENTKIEAAFTDYAKHIGSKVVTLGIDDLIGNPDKLKEIAYDTAIVSDPENTETSNTLLLSLGRYSHTQEFSTVLLANDPPDSHILNGFARAPVILKRPIIIGNVFKNQKTSSTEQLNVIKSKTETPKDLEENHTLQLLIAEDNAVNRMVIDGLLKKIGIGRTFAENGLEAVQQFCRDDARFDAILMDCEMPELDGFDATLQIREWERKHTKESTPIIALTAHVEAEHRRRVVDVGMNFYVSKPVNFKKISEALETFGLL